MGCNRAVERTQEPYRLETFACRQLWTEAVQSRLPARFWASCSRFFRAASIIDFFVLVLMTCGTPDGRLVSSGREGEEREGATDDAEHEGDEVEEDDPCLDRTLGAQKRQSSRSRSKAYTSRARGTFAQTPSKEVPRSTTTALITPSASFPRKLDEARVEQDARA